MPRITFRCLHSDKAEDGRDGLGLGRLIRKHPFSLEREIGDGLRGQWHGFSSVIVGEIETSERIYGACKNSRTI